MQKFYTEDEIKRLVRKGILTGKYPDLRKSLELGEKDTSNIAEKLESFFLNDPRSVILNSIKSSLKQPGSISRFNVEELIKRFESIQHLKPSDEVVKLRGFGNKLLDLYKAAYTKEITQKLKTIKAFEVQWEKLLEKPNEHRRQK